jgi:hypothetical protein
MVALLWTASGCIWRPLGFSALFSDGACIVFSDEDDEFGPGVRLKKRGRGKASSRSSDWSSSGGPELEPRALLRSAKVIDLWRKRPLRRPVGYMNEPYKNSGALN